MRRRKRVVVPRGPAFVPCGACSCGWVMRIAWERTPPRVEVRRCPCWLAHQMRLTLHKDAFDARMAQVGSE